MRKRHDQFAKRMLRVFLEPTGVVRPEQEVAPDIQHIDVWFVPDPAKDAERRQLGLLGKLTSGACLLEPFRNTPSFNEVKECLRKLLGWEHIQRLEQRKKDVSGSRQQRNRPPVLWILSPGVPRQTLRHLPSLAAGCRQPGVYQGELGLGLIVLSELPATPHTLSLRLLGRDATQRAAFAELQALPREARQRQTLLKLVVRLSLELPKRSAQAREFLMNAKRTYEQWEAELLEKGHKEGVFEGKQETLRKIVFQRFQSQPAWLDAWLEACTSLETLDGAVLAAVAAQDLKDLRQRLKAQPD